METKKNNNTKRAMTQNGHGNQNVKSKQYPVSTKRPKRRRIGSYFDSGHDTKPTIVSNTRSDVYNVSVNGYASNDEIGKGYQDSYVTEPTIEQNQLWDEEYRFRQYRTWKKVGAITELPNNDVSNMLVILERRTKQKQRVVSLAQYVEGGKKRIIDGYDSKRQHLIGYYVTNESDFIHSSVLDVDDVYNGFSVIVKIDTGNGVVLKEGLVHDGRIVMEGIPVGDVIGFYAGPHIRYEWKESDKQWVNF